MSKPFFTLLVILTISSSFITQAQIKQKDLQGNWILTSPVQSYHGTDTLHFIYDRLNETSHNQIHWTIKKKLLYTQQTSIKSTNSQDFTISLKKSHIGQVLSIENGEKQTREFKVIPPPQGKSIKDTGLTLLPVDELNQKKLYHYVDSLVVNVLNYQPTTSQNSSLNDTTHLDSILRNAVPICGILKLRTIDPAPLNPSTKVKTSFGSKLLIRDAIPHNPKPLLIIDGYPIQDYTMLQKLRFVEVVHIEVLKGVSATALYGMRATNGVIILQVSDKVLKRFKTS